jgi:hypothetical protein
MPKYAIANGLFMGQLPVNLANFTRVSWKACTATALMGSTGYVKVFFKNLPRQHRLKGHCTAARVDLKTVMRSLPLHPDDVPIRVYFANPYSKAERIRSTKEEVLSKAQVRQICVWLRTHNILYHHFDLSDETLNDNSNLNAMPDDEVPDSMMLETSEHNAVENDSLAGPHITQSFASRENVPDVLHTIKVPLPQAARPRHQRPQCYTADVLKQGRFVLRSSSTLEKAHDKEWMTKAFPKLYPFGRGGWGEERAVRLSRKAYFNHLLRLSSGVFQDWEFVLHAYDLIAREDLYQAARLKAVIPTSNRQSAADTWATIPTAELQLAAAHQDAVGKALSAGKPMPPAPSGVTARARSFAQSVSATTKAAQHTPEHSLSSRIKMYSTHYRFGTPTWWITISPGSANSYRVWQLGAGDCLDKQPDRPPDRVLRFANVSNNPGACAAFFEHILQVFFETMVGWDFVKKRGSVDGLFGHVRAFTYAVETQGRGDLHAHILLWTYNHANLEERLSAQSGALLQLSLDNIQRSLDHNICVEVPLQPQQQQSLYACRKDDCDGTYGGWTEQRLRALRANRKDQDPNVLRCDECGHKVGSYLLLKTALAQAWNSNCEGEPPHGDEDLLDDLLWEAIPLPCSSTDDMQITAYKVKLAEKIFDSQKHYATHTASCFKKGCMCRYKAPWYPHEHSEVTLKDDTAFVVLQVQQKRGPAHIWVSAANKHMLEVLPGNSNFAFVKDHRYALFMSLEYNLN